MRHVAKSKHLMASHTSCMLLSFFLPMVLILCLTQPILAQSRSICITQFSLANQACSVLPLLQSFESADGANHSHWQRQGHHNDNGHGHHRGHDHGRHGNHHHGHGTHGHNHNQTHGHHHGHSQHNHDHGQEDDNVPRAVKDCCRWMEVVDHGCVCEALLKLPHFLIKNRHKYTISVQEVCRFTYKCQGI